MTPRRRLGLEELPVQLLVAAEVDPVALAPLRRRGKDVGRLRAGLDFRLRHDVVAALGVGEEHPALPVADLDRVRAGRHEVGVGTIESAGGLEAQDLLADRRPPVADEDPAATDGAGHVEPDPQRVRFAPAHVDDAFVVRARVAADPPHRLVRLAEPQELLGLEERVGLLVPEEAGLDLEVRALVVRERAAPVLALVVRSPRTRSSCPACRGGRPRAPSPSRSWGGRRP